MFVPAHARNDNTAELLAVMRAYSFATLVTASPDGGDAVPFVTHLPVVVAEESQGIRISAHVARANPHGRVLHARQTLVVFHGPHGYVSPTAYEARQSVPTWNYVAVHATGTATVITDPALCRARIEELVSVTDPSYHTQWAELSPTFQTNMLNGVVAFDISVDRLEGQFKLSQNKTLAERTRVAEALLHADDPAARETGALMLRRQREPG